MKKRKNFLKSYKLVKNPKSKRNLWKYADDYFYEKNRIKRWVRED